MITRCASTLECIALRRVFVAATLIAAAWCGTAAASPITEPTQLVGPQTLINFNGLATGAQSSPLTLSGVTFSGNLSVIDVDAYGAAAAYPAYTSDKALGIPGLPGNPVLFTITFASAVAQVGMGIFDTNFAGDLISAYDSLGNLLETTAPNALFPPGGSGADYVGFLRSSADIASIRITAGIQNGTTDALWIDNLSFSAQPVSAPGTLLLTLTGLLAVVRLRRSRG